VAGLTLIVRGMAMIGAANMNKAVMKTACGMRRPT
jgi:hypothetical protein